MGFSFTARCDACGHQIDVRDLDAMKGWMRGHYAHGCTMTRERVIRDCIAATEAEMQRNGWDETTIRCTTQPMRALLEGEKS